MAFVHFVIVLSLIFNIQIAVSFHHSLGQTFFRTKSSSFSNSKNESPRIRINLHMSTLSHKNNDAHEVITKTKLSRVTKSTPIKNLISADTRTLEEIISILSEHQSDMIVVRFYAPWCKVRGNYIFGFLLFLLHGPH